MKAAGQMVVFAADGQRFAVALAAVERVLRAESLRGITAERLAAAPDDDRTQVSSWKSLLRF